MRLNTNKNSINVLGALNMDLIMNIDTPAKPGETSVGTKFYTAPGGKGGNQAVAAARITKERSVSFFGIIGKDDYGNQLKQFLEAEKINTSNILIDDEMHSGIAIIFNDKNDQNYVNAVYGSNAKYDESLIKQFKKNISQTKVLITQNELDTEITLECMKIAQKNNVKIILDPAPYRKNLPKDYFLYPEIITPNETEAEYMTGIKIESIDDAKKASEIIIDSGVKSVAITLGENGVYYKDSNNDKYFKPFKVQEIKASVAAGDCFTGILGSCISLSININTSIDMAVVGSALSVTREGAQESMPFYDEIKKIL